MSTIRAFRALRPEPGRAAAVSAVPYDVVNAAEAAQLADGNPLSFLRVSRAEIELPAGAGPYADEVYRTAARNFERLRREAPLVEEATPTLYLYRLRMGEHEQTGIAATFSVDEYERDVILKHEKTRKEKEDDRTRHIIELRAQTGPVFLTYPAHPGIDALVDTATSGPAARAPLFDFVAPDGVAHTVWTATDAEAAAIVDAFGGIPALYIADGHHRAASAMRTRQALRERGEARGEADWFLAVAFPHDQMQVLPYHRVVKDLNGLTPGAFLAKLRARMRVESGGDTPAGPGEVCMRLDGTWYQLRLPRFAGDPPPADRLDVAVLQAEVLAPILGIGDPRTDKRIDFVGGIRGPEALVSLVDGGSAAVAFAMYPTRVEEVMEIAASGEIMPPKSTWFEPKLRDGLLIHLI